MFRACCCSFLYYGPFSLSSVLLCHLPSFWKPVWFFISCFGGGDGCGADACGTPASFCAVSPFMLDIACGEDELQPALSMGIERRIHPLRPTPVFGVSKLVRRAKETIGLPLKL